MSRRRHQAPDSVEVLPGYRDAAEIGGGAFATVYRAVESDTGRPVALKILKVDTVHPHLLETFAQEIHALAKVSHHPNIVTLYRPATTPDGRPVLVLELCRESLAQGIRRQGPLSPQDATRIGIKIAGALETAHRAGFLHRDMKPQNILWTQFGEPALADFGVAALQASAQATAGVFGFTTLHAAPEMLEGHRLSPATDVYGLASTMYQLITGLAPFAAFDNEAPASVILRIIRDPVRPLRSESAPIALSDLLEEALAKDPGGRPETAAGFAASLRRVETLEGWPPTTYVAFEDGGENYSAPPASTPPASTPPAWTPPSAEPRAAHSVKPPPPVPAPPPPPARSTGPGISQPAAAERHVLLPEGHRRRGMGAPMEPLSQPLPPLTPAPSAGGIPSFDAPTATRPRFVDPDDPTRSLPESIYEATLLPGAVDHPEALRGQHDEPARRRELLPIPKSAALAGLCAAVLVALLAVLLSVGVV